MTVEAVLVGLPGTLCSPAMFEPMTRGLAGEVDVVPFSWLTQPGPWDIPSVAERVAGHLEENWSWPVIVCGHSTGGVIALQLAVRHPALVGGLVLVDTGAHMHGHGDVDAILQRVKDNWGEDLRAAVLDRSFRDPLDDQARAFNASQVGKVLPVLFERPGRHPGQLIGRSPYLQAVHATAPDRLVGQIVPVRIEAAARMSLAGALVSEELEPAPEMAF